MSRWRSAAVAVALVSACDNSEECAQLRQLHEKHQRALAIGRARAGLAQKTQRDAEAAEQRTQRLMAKYGLDMSEEDILRALQKRVASIPGAKVERSVRAAEGGDGRPSSDQTLWTIRLPTRVFAEAAQHARDLAAMPPALQLATLLPPRGDDEGWLIELVQVVVDRLPIKFEPQPLPIPPDPADVPSRLGFCGASALRAGIDQAR
ncbi:MAG: hypothetical protein AAFN74_10660, partial [Myxococcota bacterium]